jgi:hypothetical protein
LASALKLLAVVLLVSAGAFAAGCLFPSLDELESAPLEDKRSVHRPSGDAGLVAATLVEGEQGAAVAADTLPDAASVECASQDVTWVVADSSCSTRSGDTLAPGASRTVVDGTLTATGKVTITCSNGVLVQTDAVCEPPHEFDVSGPHGCGKGYCAAVMAANCGHPDPAKAKDLCVKKGYADQTSFKTEPSQPGATICFADETTCGVTQNPCNIVFTSVTCRH